MINQGLVIRMNLKTGVQGKYADRFNQGTNLVLLVEDAARASPTDQAVNEALRLVIQLGKLPRLAGKPRTRRAYSSA